MLSFEYSIKFFFSIILPAQQFIQFFVQVVAFLFQIFSDRFFSSGFGHVAVVGYAHQYFLVAGGKCTVQLHDQYGAADAL